MHWFYFTIPLIATTSLYAALEIGIDEKNPLPVTFSRISHNRISVEDGAVERVIGDGSIFSVTLDRVTGNAFVNVLRDIGEKPIMLTVITSSGLIQDLSISSYEGHSQHVILQEEEEIEEFLPNEELFHAATVEILNKILEGKIPLGYGQRGLEGEEKLELPNPLIATPVKAFEGASETIIVYRLQNNGRQPVVITSDSLKKDDHLWVFLNGQELKSKEQVLCVMAFPKNRKKL